MSKADFKKTLDSYQAKHKEFRIVAVPAMQYLMIDGHGDPNTSQEFADAVASLFPVAYKLKFLSKQELDKDYTVMPLEGLWWSDNMATFTTARDKSAWDWTMMIMQPDWITPDMFDVALQKVTEKNLLNNLAKVRLERLEEGQCVQTLHIGSYDDEAPVLAEMHDVFIPANNFTMSGKHHEIYFSDFRKVAPDKLKTLLRQPVAKA